MCGKCCVRFELCQKCDYAYCPRCEECVCAPRTGDDGPTPTKHIMLWEILVPTVKPGFKNKFFTTRYHKVWDKKIKAIAGGLTILKPGIGEWISPSGEHFNERMIPVRIYCSESEIDAIADITAEYYNQEAIMYYKISDHVRINHYDKCKV